MIVVSEHLEEYLREQYGDDFFTDLDIIRPERTSPFAEFVFPQTDE